MILVSGAGGGIGQATCRRLTEAGRQVLAIGKNLTTVPFQYATEYLRCDVTKELDLLRIAEIIDRRGIVLEGCFLAAGGGGFSSIESSDQRYVEDVVALNLSAQYLTLRAMRPFLVPGASIVLCGSAIANLGIPSSGVYAAAKAGIESLTRSLAVEFGTKARVNCVSPGAIETSLYQRLGLDIERVRQHVARNVPMARMGKPEEVAAVVEFLFSNQSSYVSGAVIEVHGGGLSNR